MHKIVIVIPYFGQLPFWMPYFLLSCEFNPSVNWVIISDQKYKLAVPKNVKFIHQSYISYCEFVSAKLNIDFYPSSPYKLCDIKPALGYIHSELIQNYDFWGFGDLDLIYGDLRAYFNEERLSQKSLFSTMATRVSGHLCLIRNDSKLNTAFMKIKDWKLIFEDNRHYAFDEKNFSKLFIKHKNLPQPIRNFLKLFNPWLRLGEFKEAFTTPNARIKWIDGSYNFPDEWYWKDGVISNNITRHTIFPYFHFMVWKNNWHSLENVLIAQRKTDSTDTLKITIKATGFSIY